MHALTRTPPAAALVQITPWDRARAASLPAAEANATMALLTRALDDCQRYAARESELCKLARCTDLSPSRVTDRRCQSSVSKAYGRQRGTSMHLRSR